jgi:DNA-binding transcriptional ArsR family regulator
LGVSEKKAFAALADPARKAILARLGEGEASAGKLARSLATAPPSLMKHIRVLEAGGLVEAQKSGRVHTCRLKPGAMTHAERWLVLSRVSARRDVVFSAWVGAKHLPNWFGPADFEIETKEIDIRVGGLSCFEMIAPNGRRPQHPQMRTCAQTVLRCSPPNVCLCIVR